MRFYTKYPINNALAILWLINGFYCKLLHLVPRHEAIVARILGSSHSGILTSAIGILEIGMAAWILSLRFHRLCAIVQAAAIASMNVIEFFLARDLLLFGPINSLLAAGLIVVIFLNERFITHQQNAVA